MLSLNVTADVREVERMLSRLGRKEVPAAAAAALNKVGATVRSRAVKSISAQTKVKQKLVRQEVKVVWKANRRDLRTIVRASRRGINLIEFVTPSKRIWGAFHRRKGVVANAWGQRKTYKGTFIGYGPRSGKNVVYVRTGKARNRLQHVRGPSIPKAFLNDVTQTVMLQVGRERWGIEFDRALQRRLARMR